MDKRFKFLTREEKLLLELLDSLEKQPCDFGKIVYSKFQINKLYPYLIERISFCCENPHMREVYLSKVYDRQRRDVEIQFPSNSELDPKKVRPEIAQKALVQFREKFGMRK